MPAASRSGQRLMRRVDERARRLALEVDDHEVGAAPQHLAQVVVAVDAGPERRDLPVEDRPEALQHLGLPGDERAPLPAHVLGQSALPALRAARRSLSVRFRIDW